MTLMKALVHAAIVEDEAKQCGLPVESIVAGDPNSIVKMPCMKSEIIETYFVLEAASKDNIDISKLALDPIMLYTKGSSILATFQN
jgi:hypothetical protein